MGQTRQRVDLVHELAQLAGAEELLDGSHDRPDVDQGLRRDGLDVLRRHALLDDALHAGQPDANLVLDQLADRTDATVGEVVLVVEPVTRLAAREVEQVAGGREHLAAAQHRLVRIRCVDEVGAQVEELGQLGDLGAELAVELVPADRATGRSDGSRRTRCGSTRGPTRPTAAHQDGHACRSRRAPRPASARGRGPSPTGPRGSRSDGRSSRGNRARSPRRSPAPAAARTGDRRRLRATRVPAVTSLPGFCSTSNSIHSPRYGWIVPVTSWCFARLRSRNRSPGWKITPGLRTSCDTTTRSVPLITNVPLSVIMGKSPMKTVCSLISPVVCVHEAGPHEDRRGEGHVLLLALLHRELRRRTQVLVVRVELQLELQGLGEVLDGTDVAEGLRQPLVQEPVEGLPLDGDQVRKGQCLVEVRERVALPSCSARRQGPSSQGCVAAESRARSGASKPEY